MWTPEQREKAAERRPNSYWADYKRQSRAARVEALRQLRLESGCVDCGYKEHAEALDFDHVVGEKEFGVLQGVRQGFSWDRIMAEVAKCEIVCANCHRVRTRQRREELEELDA